MSSPQTIDFAALLTEIAGANPAGEDLRYEGTYDTIQAQMHEDDDLEQGDWQRETKVADWRAVIETATTALATKSKDLQIAAWLTRALGKRHGFAGLRDGFQLLRELEERFWETLYPELEDGDAEFRTGPFEGLNAALPLVIRQVALTRSGNGEEYTLLHWDEAKKLENLARQNQEAYQAALDDGKVTSEQFNKAVASTPRAFYETLYEDLQQSVEECERLDRVSDEKFGRLAPSFVAIKKVLDDSLDLVRRIRKEKREREGIKEENVAVPADGGNQMNGGQRSPQPVAAATSVPAGTVVSGNLPLEPQSRPDALHRLEAVAVYFRRTEPHSPVAYLVERAVRWAGMPLEEWLHEMIKSEDVLGQVKEHLGIKDRNNNAGDSSENTETN
jgi:type VI secretion system protein ImpA